MLWICEMNVKIAGHDFKSPNNFLLAWLELFRKQYTEVGHIRIWYIKLYNTQSFIEDQKQVYLKPKMYILSNTHRIFTIFQNKSISKFLLFWNTYMTIYFWKLHWNEYHCEETKCYWKTVATIEGSIPLKLFNLNDKPRGSA